MPASEPGRKTKPKQAPRTKAKLEPRDVQRRPVGPRGRVSPPVRLPQPGSAPQTVVATPSPPGPVRQGRVTTKPSAAPAESAPKAKSWIVRPGDTLWSIAAKVAGPTASAAEIAQEVDRLWRLNAERIGSGRPDLIVPGERLRLG